MSWISQLPALASVPQARSNDFARLIATAVFSDQRGRFVTPWDSSFDVPGFSPQSMHFSHNSQTGTLRGLHYTDPPFEQAKLVHCVRGRLFDLVVDMRENSPTFRAWKSFQLDADSAESVWIPAGYAQEFLTLEHVKLLILQSTWRRIDWPKNNRISYRPCFGEHCCKAR